MILLRPFKRFLLEVWASIIMRSRGFRDFYQFPFEVSTPLNEHAEETLKEACLLLESIDINYFLCDGTILGIVRDNKLIPHDNDIDVAVVGEIELETLKATFLAQGYGIGRELYYRGRIQQLIFYSKHQVIFDICFWNGKGDEFYYHYVPEVEKGRRQSKKWYNTHDYVTFHGKKYPTHANIKEWLRGHFGDDWTTPKQSKGDWRLDVRDIIK